MSATATTAAAEIVNQMSAADRATFDRDAWESGVSSMLQGEWSGLDLGDVLDTIERLVSDELITDDNVRALKREAAQAGDLDQVELCTAALHGDGPSWQRCVEVILDARAMA